QFPPFGRERSGDQTDGQEASVIGGVQGEGGSGGGQGRQDALGASEPVRGLSEPNLGLEEAARGGAPRAVRGRPETVAALKLAIAQRPKPNDPEYNGADCATH